MRIYLAGKMTGIERFNFPAFDAAALRLRAQGHDVVSPAELAREAGFDGSGPLPPGFTEQAMRRDIAAILKVDAVAVLAGWQASKGTARELVVALSVGIPVLDADTLQPVDPLGESGPLAQLFGRAEELPAETVLEEAQRLVYGAREQAYSHPFDDYTRTGRMWGAVLDGWLRQQPGFEAIPQVPDVDPRICCLMMVQVKVSREVHRHKRDNCVDGPGYFACAQRVAERQGL